MSAHRAARPSRRITILFSWILAVPLCADVLFPTPLHLTRETRDPITGGSATVEEYAYANRVVAVRNGRTAITDHGAGTLTIIDFHANTYSVTPLVDLETPQRRSSQSASKGTERHEITVDPKVILARQAIEALIGETAVDAVLDAARIRDRITSDASATRQELYALPIQHDVVVDVGGETVAIRSRITRVGHELPPSELMAIPQNAKRIDHPGLAAKRLLHDIDRLPITPRP